MVIHESTDDIVCPYCGHALSDSWEYQDECDKVECPMCNKFFSWSRLTSINYSTSKLCKENGKEHVFSGWWYREPWSSMGIQYGGFYVRHCEECEHVETTNKKPKDY